MSMRACCPGVQLLNLKGPLPMAAELLNARAFIKFQHLGSLGDRNGSVPSTDWPPALFAQMCSGRRKTDRVFLMKSANGAWR